MMYRISLEAARVNAGLSQKDAAKQMGINVGTLSNWERGNTSPSIEQFKALCDLYGCPSNLVFSPKKFALSE